jgi:hypothetical protein
MLLHAYLDGSENDEFFIVAGYVAPFADWQLFSKKWHDILKERPRLGYFRTSDALALKGQFERFNRVNRDQRIAGLASVIPDDDNCLAVASYVAKREFKTFFTPNFLTAWDDPYYLCSMHLIEHTCRSLSGRSATTDRIDFIFDREGKVGDRFRLVYNAFLRGVSLLQFPFLGDVKHEDKEEYIPLQAADMQAGWMRRRLSLVQVPTSADCHLSNIHGAEFPISRSFLERIAAYKRAHAEEIAAFWDSLDGGDS